MSQSQALIRNQMSHVEDYDDEMRTSIEIFRRKIKRLCGEEGRFRSATALAEFLKMWPRTLTGYLREDKPKDMLLGMLDQVAAGLGMEPWELITPGIAAEAEHPFILEARHLLRQMSEQELVKALAILRALKGSPAQDAHIDSGNPYRISHERLKLPEMDEEMRGELEREISNKYYNSTEHLNLKNTGDNVNGGGSLSKRRM